MRYCQNCSKYACNEHLVTGVYGYGDVCIDCAKTFKKSCYGIGNIWFKKKKGATKFNISKTKILDIDPKKIDKVYSLIEKQMKDRILIHYIKPNTLNYVGKGREINIALEEKEGKIAFKLEWKAEYGNMFSEKDFKKFDMEFGGIIKKIENKFKIKKGNV